MAITVTMIEEKEFKTKVRGYDPVEVDEFLDAICDEMVEMQNTIQTLRDQLKQRTMDQPSASFAPLPVAPVAPPSALAPIPQVAGLKEEEASVPTDIETAQNLLADTQRACDEALEKARQRARDLLQEAEDQVPDPELVDLEEQREKVREEIEKLKKEAQAFRERFQSMLNDQKDILDTEAELF